MRSIKLEITVGLFVLTGILALGWMSIRLARMELLGGNYTPIYAIFSTVSGLKPGARVEIAGVEIGRVESISLDKVNYQAQVLMKVLSEVQIQEDAIAAIRTKGMIGDRYIRISPGASEVLLKANDKLVQTEPAIQIEELISQYVHGAVK